MELNLKEKIIFAKFKDKPIDDFKIFREKMSEKFGFPLSDNLIRELRIYQKKKSQSQPFREYVKYFANRSPHYFRENIKRCTRRRQAIKDLERLEEISPKYPIGWYIRGKK